MSKKNLSMDEFMKVAAQEGVELNDDMLNAVDGGYYTRDEWAAMTAEEQQMAQLESIMAMKQRNYCKLFDPN